MANKVGRPLLFKTVEELQNRIEGYWEYCEEKEKPITMSGLAYYLDIDRNTLINYGNRDEFLGTIKKARARVQMDQDERMQTIGNPTAGIIFSLKNNFDWTDKKETEIKTEGVKVVIHERS